MFRKIYILTLYCAIFFSLYSAEALAKDTWIAIKSKNFNLIGNASEKEMRGVATKLEQFREVFRQLFSKANFTQSVETNVVVFKDKKSYSPFLPKDSKGKARENIAGYFQKGDDVNYITLSAEGQKEDTYGTVFHEYVHFIVDTNFGRSNVPPWFNEGLAEYYQTFQIENDQKVTLGGLQNGHLALLDSGKLMPLKEFFEMDNRSLTKTGNHSRSIFYAQSWALMHYLIQGNPNGKQQLNAFLEALLKNSPPEKAFKDAFGIDYAAMEKMLRKYVSQRLFNVTIGNFKKKLTFDADIKVSALSEAEAKAYLGDLLYHIHEIADAEKYLAEALSLDPSSGLANTTMGLIKARQRKFSEARPYLEKGIASNQKNHLAHFNYAYAISRESMDEFGYVLRFSEADMKTMRAALQKAMEINPYFTESHRLFAFISLVNNENTDDALGYLQKALAIRPGNPNYLLLTAQIYHRQKNWAAASALAKKLTETADSPDVKKSAESLLAAISKMMDQKNGSGNDQEEQRPAGTAVPAKIKPSESGPDPEEIKKAEQNEEILMINSKLAKLKPGEKRIIGRVESISCAAGAINYSGRNETGTFLLTSKDFQSLNLFSYINEAIGTQVGCGKSLKTSLTVLTYLPSRNSKSKSIGTLLAIDFVPEYFRLQSPE